MDNVIPCADEPIHLAGSVQQHGFYLMLDPPFERVIAASENAERFLGIPLKLILNSRLADLFEREVIFSLKRVHPDVCETTPSVELNTPVTFLGIFSIHGEAFSIVSHCVGLQRVLEFEVQNRLVPAEMMNGVITNFVSTIGSLRSERELCHALALQIAAITSFDRIMVYSFDDAGVGTVLAEVNNGKLPSYLHLRFPGTDIPAQARRLYTINTVRIIPDVYYTPSPLVAAPNTLSTHEIDLSYSTLRSVSPVHVEYMRNMGTKSSFSVSILVNGKLWGLVSGHHAEPHSVPYLIRSACDMLARLASTQINNFQTTARLEEMVHLHATQREVLTQLAAEPDHMNGLLQQLGKVQQIANAGGVALVVDGNVFMHGEVPSAASIAEIATWVSGRSKEGEVFASSAMGREPEWADREEVLATASGVLSMSISSVLDRYVMWFRPEIVRTVRWAGEPEKIVGQDRRLHPRGSFAEWKETVRGQAEPWSKTEVESANDFRAALTTIGLRKAEEAVELGEARFQRLTESLPVKIFLADDEGRLTYTNDQWLHAGLPLTGRWFETSILSDEDRELCRERWMESTQHNRPFEAEVLTHDGRGDRDRWNIVRAVPFQRAGASRAGWVGTFVDLTESKEREAAMRVNEKLALTGRMTSVIAHEINNPLEAITNLMYLLRNEVQQTEGSACTYIGMVESELERISGITKQTLRWNRENSDLAEQFSGIAMVEDVLRLFAGKIRNRHIHVETIGDREVSFHGILGQLRQILANLVSNGIDAAPVGGQLTIRLFEGDGLRGFSVTDNGAGIPAELQGRLFQPFISTKGDLGNGLGLYISKEIAERHGGTIHVESTPGVGTTMTVELPEETVLS